MDVAQKHVLRKVQAFVGEKFEDLESVAGEEIGYVEKEPWISLNRREAYVVLKLFEEVE